LRSFQQLKNFFRKKCSFDVDLKNLPVYKKSNDKNHAKDVLMQGIYVSKFVNFFLFWARHPTPASIGVIFLRKSHANITPISAACRRCEKLQKHPLTDVVLLHVLCVALAVVIIHMMIFMVLSSWLRAIGRVYLVHLMNADCESAGRLLSFTFTIAILLLLNLKAETRVGWKADRSRHCSKGVQPMPKAVYRSGCHDKHNSNLHPLTLQLDALTTRPLRPAGSSYMFCELLFYQYAC